MKTIERLIPLGLLLILGAEQYFYGGAWLTLVALLAFAVASLSQILAGEPASLSTVTPSLVVRAST